MNKPLQLRVKIAESSEHPVSIIRNSDGKQVYINNKLSELLEISKEEATKRNMPNYWDKEWYTQLTEKMSKENKFRLEYNAYLNPGVPACIVSDFDIFESGGASYRMVSMLSCTKLLTE